MIRVLYVNDDPHQILIEEVFRNLGIKIELTVATSVEKAKHYLCAFKFDTVFMDYELDFGQNAVSSGLVKMALEKGFGVGKKPLIAYSQGYNHHLLEAGCSDDCLWYNIDELVCKLFTV